MIPRLFDFVCIPFGNVGLRDLTRSFDFDRFFQNPAAKKFIRCICKGNLSRPGAVHIDVDFCSGLFTRFPSSTIGGIEYFGGSLSSLDISFLAWSSLVKDLI